jgi:hypothetical protein
MANNYANIKTSTTKGSQGGYKPALFFAPIGDITTWGRPLAVPVAKGDKVKITTAHIFAATKTAAKWEAKLHSVTHKTLSVGDEGASDLEHTAEVKFLGDDEVIHEMVKDLLNDQVAIWLKDSDCLNNDSYIQLGDDCVPVSVKVDFDGKTTKDGKKEYTVTFTTKAKYFYLAALDIAP